MLMMTLPKGIGEVAEEVMSVLLRGGSFDDVKEFYPDLDERDILRIVEYYYDRDLL